MTETFRYVVDAEDQVDVVFTLPDQTVVTIRVLPGSKLLLEGDHVRGITEGRGGTVSPG